MLEQDLQALRGVEGGRAGEHLVDHHPQGVDVGPGVEGALPAALLWGHVVRRAHDHAAAGLVAAVDPGDAEVDDHGFLPAVGRAGQQDVRGLEIAVHDPDAVGLGERTGHVLEDGHGVAEEHRPPGEAIFEALALDQGHDDVAEARERPLGHGAIVEDGHDVIAGQLGQRPGLPLEAHAIVAGGGDKAVERLHRHHPIQPQIQAPVHHPHAAAAHAVDEGVAIRDELPQERGDLAVSQGRGGHRDPVVARAAHRAEIGGDPAHRADGPGPAQGQQGLGGISLWIAHGCIRVICSAMPSSKKACSTARSKCRASSSAARAAPSRSPWAVSRSASTPRADRCSSSRW